MKIPSSFQLGGTTWRVVLVDGLDNLGLTERDVATIKLRAGMPPQVLEVAFWHEFGHAMRYTMGIAEGHDEVEIDAQAHLLHQFINSRK